MKLATRSRPLIILLAILVGSIVRAGPSVALEGFVETNGVRLQYLEWGGTGPALILIHGLGDNAHVFDDLAPAFVSRFHVIAYSRRGSGGSEIKGPYDAVTLGRDLLGVMDALGIKKADLVGYSAGGVDITELAAEHPDHVGRVVYFEGGYDGADPDFKALAGALPVGFFEPSATAMASLEAFRAYQKATQYAQLDDMYRIEANLRQKVIIQPDGSLKYRLPKEVIAELYGALMANARRDYTPVRCPVLAIYADTLYDRAQADPTRRDELAAFDLKYWKPFQSKSIAQLRRQLPNAQVLRVPGTHAAFFMTSRQPVVTAMTRFLTESAQPGAP
jgi:pimeloyl-ACP methyl ester carboxylesterase